MKSFMRFFHNLSEVIKLPRNMAIFKNVFGFFGAIVSLAICIAICILALGVVIWLYNFVVSPVLVFLVTGFIGRLILCSAFTFLIYWIIKKCSEQKFQSSSYVSKIALVLALFMFIWVLGARVTLGFFHFFAPSASYQHGVLDD